MENIDEKIRYGFISQDIKAFLESKGVDVCSLSFISTCEETSYMSLKYEQIIPILHSAIKEVDQENQILKNEIASLKSDIQNIKTLLNII